MILYIQVYTPVCTIQYFDVRNPNSETTKKRQTKRHLGRPNDKIAATTAAAAANWIAKKPAITKSPPSKRSNSEAVKGGVRLIISTDVVY